MTVLQGAAGNGMPASSAAGGVDMSAVLAAVQQQAAQGMPGKGEPHQGSCSLLEAAYTTLVV
jgi:hypothetical protein